jgi:tetratricopeptide (TPR) repeat protein
MVNLNPLKLLQAKAVILSMKSFFDYRRFLVVLSLICCLVSLSHTALAQNDEKDPVQLFSLGQDAHEKGDLKTALKFYEEALKIAPEFPEAEFQRGHALQSLGRHAEAEKAFRRAVELRENWVLPLVGLGEILTRGGKFAEAEPVLSKAVELDEKNSAALSALTELRLKTKAAPDVLKNLRQKLENFLTPDAAVWTARGAIESRLGDKAAARRSLARALTLEPKNSFALSEMTEILLAEKDLTAALENTQNLVKFYPTSIPAQLLLARVYAESGQLEQTFKIVESLDTQNSEVIAFRTEITAKGSKDVGVLEKQLESDAKNPAILGRLCVLTRTDPARALEYCRRASEAEPQNVSHAVGFGAALVQAKQFESAVSLLRRLLSFDPENFAIHANLATALFELKRYAEAKTEFQWLIAKKSDLAVAYYFLAIAHDNLAEYSQALTNYQKFLQIADAKQNQLEIEKVNFRLPILEKQIKSGKGKSK